MPENSDLPELFNERLSWGGQLYRRGRQGQCHPVVMTTGHQRLVDSRCVSQDDPQVQMLFSEQWPAFITHDEDVKPFLDRRVEYFSDLDYYVLDDDGAVIAGAWCVPLRWDGSVRELPAGYTDLLKIAVEQREKQTVPDTLALMAAVVRPDLKRAGVASRAVALLKAEATSRGFQRMLAPVRPTLKCRYPLTPIQQYMRWRRSDGALLDPWLRTHERAGGKLLAPAPASQQFTGTITEWERWVDLPLPDSGRYVFPEGLDVLVVDADADHGAYVEPNVWVRHL